MKRLLQNNKIFIAFALLMICTGIIFSFSEWIGKNPFVDNIEIEAPVQGITSNDTRYVIADSSYEINILDTNNRFIKRIIGNNHDETFDYAMKIEPIHAGSFYLLDKRVLDDGITPDCQRILLFEEYGKKRTVIYEENVLNKKNKLVSSIESIQAVGDTVWFSKKTGDSLDVYRCSNDSVERMNHITVEDAIHQINTCDFNEKGAVAYTLMNGDMHYVNENGEELSLQSGYEEGSHSMSLYTELCFEGDTLYVNDICQRRILKIQHGKISEILTPDHFKNGELSSLAQESLFTGLNVCDNNVSVLVCSYVYLDEIDEHGYQYSICTIYPDGVPMELTDIMKMSMLCRMRVFCVYFAMLISAIVLLFLARSIFIIIRKQGSFKNKTQIAVLITSICFSFFVASSVFSIYTENYTSMSISNLTNMGYLLEETLDKDALAQLSLPSTYGNEAYQKVDASVQNVLKGKESVTKSAYVVLYRVFDNVIYEIYRNQGDNPVMYPLAGSYKDSAEEEIAKSGEVYSTNNITLAEGSYSYVDIPVYDENGEFLTLIEIGMDYWEIEEQNDRLFRSIMIKVFMIIIIIMLLLSEVFGIGSTTFFNHSHRGLTESFPPENIRPIAFLVFFTANITTTFLPIYGMSLWNEKFPLQSEIAAALPLSAELVCGAVVSILCAKLLQRHSPKMLCRIGAGFYVCGNLISIFAKNLWMLIGANSCCGIGGGLLLVSINTWIMLRGDEKEQNRGFIHYNAAFLSGMNCGSVIGALIWEKYGITSAYCFAGGSALVLFISIFFFMDNKKQNTVEKAKEDCFLTKLRHVFTGRLIRYYLCMAIPYLICASFLSYFFPIIAERNSLTASEISMAFLVSGAISIYIGTSIGESIVDVLSVKKSMILASFLYASALFYLVYRPSIASCFVVIVMFAIADSFGLSAQAVFFAELPEVIGFGEGNAQALNSTVESLTSAMGSLIFGSILMLGYRKGIFILGVIFAAMLLVFVIGEKSCDEENISVCSDN